MVVAPLNSQDGSNFKIATFNCQGFKTRMYDYIKELFYSCDILVLQETWLYNFEHHMFCNILPDCQYYAVSAMDEADLGRKGRPYGGCSIIWHKNLSISVSPISTSSSRICAVEIKSDTSKFMLITVYMPNDENSDRSYEIYGDVLSQISSIICNYDHDILIGGDFNVDFDRLNSNNLTLLKQFIQVEDLLCNTTDILSNNFTREDCFGTRSFIDHFIVNKNLKYSNLKVLYNGDNLSDHNPVIMQTSLNVLSSDTETYRYKVIDWEKANDNDIENYKILLNSYLEQYSLPFSVTRCNNLFCTSHDDIIIEKIEELLEIMSCSAELTIPTKIISNKPRGIPGWNDFVKQYKDKSILSNELWVSAGKPTSGPFFEERKSARYKYHWAIKQVKKNKESIISSKTAQQLTNKSFRDFWKFIKKYKGNSKSSSKIIDGKCTDETIAAHFRTIYDSLYSSVTDNTLDNTKLKINNLVSHKCSTNSCSSNCQKVSVETIRNAVKSLTKGKDDEIYNVFSDNFTHATDAAFNILATLITIMLKHGTASELLNRAIVKPIPKNNKKSLSDSSNYRAISKNSIMSKIIDHVLICLIGEKMNTSNYQFAYKAGFSTSLCSFLVAETISYYRTRGSNVYMVSLDATKAFDRVQYSKLFNKLIKRDICPLIIRFLLNSYVMSKSFVQWNNSKSNLYSINNDVKRGAVLSVPMFVV